MAALKVSVEVASLRIITVQIHHLPREVAGIVDELPLNVGEQCVEFVGSISPSSCQKLVGQTHFFELFSQRAD